MTEQNLQIKRHTLRHYGLVVTFGVVAGIVVVFLVPYGIRLMSNQNPQDAITSVPVESPFSRQLPVKLEIPAISLDTTFVPPLGLNPDKTVSVPDSFTEVGWYKNGASPGEVGPAVILGHVDSKDGPAVFVSLGQLKEGDEVNVTRADGTVATFVVTKLVRYPQDNFPTLDVYGPTDDATLRLVTCTGVYDRGEQRYSHNLVVYATLKR